MSRIGKKPVIIPKGVQVTQKGRTVEVSGPLGKLQMDFHPVIKIEINSSAGEMMVVNEQPNHRQARQLHGTMRALLANMVTGVSSGFEKKMKLYGTGYNVKQQGDKLVFQVGFSHPVEVSLPGNIKAVLEVPATRGNDVPAKFTLSGPDKHLLGQIAANIRAIKPPEPYKGKGFRYADEHIKRKVGKAFASGTV